MKSINIKEILKELETKTINNSNKYDFGNVLIIAGDIGMTGSSILAASSCIETGVGLVTIATECENFNLGCNYRPEIMFINKNKLDIDLLNTYDVIGIGPGLVYNNSNLELLKLVLQTNKHIVIDATAIKLFKEIENFHSYNVIITPHLGEYEYLFHTSSDVDLTNSNLIVVQKGHISKIMTSETTYYNIKGTNKMGTAGMGDVLFGMIVSLVAQYNDKLLGAQAALYIHTDVAFNLEPDYYKVTPSLVIDNVNRHMKKLMK
jgi:hydroxyethylthiazole kinase-like uncharacterized protein yjeF